MARLALIAMLAWLPASAGAQTCPFDTGGSDATYDGMVLTRYALAITGAPLLASTRYASLDPLQVKNNIECVGCALDMNGDGQIDTVDTTITARYLAGFKGASLTAGLARGVAPTASRPSTAAVVSFLATGDATGPTGAFVQGGNAFGATAVLGTIDNQNMKVSSAGTQVSVEIAGGNGLRVLKTTDPAYPDAPVVINGSASNVAGDRASTVAGGGFTGTVCLDPPTGMAGRSCRNEASDLAATVSGGFSNVASAAWAVVSGGYGNTADGGAGSVIAGGYGNLTAASNYGIVGGGFRNNVQASYGTIPGGQFNIASGVGSFAAGQYASALHGSFVWGDNSTTSPIASNAANQFVIRSTGGVHLNPPTRLYFGRQTRQMINLWGTSATTPDEFGIGVQTGTAYFRSNSNFCWHAGGTHSDAFCTAGRPSVRRLIQRGQ